MKEFETYEQFYKEVDVDDMIVCLRTDTETMKVGGTYKVIRKESPSCLVLLEKWSKDLRYIFGLNWGNYTFGLIEKKINL